ncbi:autotransporter outer membrane beta-barrel domain-containing protein [Achromobacter sp. UMC71]|nr:autotransporter outer membrane beta-barrel domain-containing protein [Achromobacter sp. UMC71]
MLLAGTGNTLVLGQGSTTLGDVVFAPMGSNRLQLSGGTTATVALSGNLAFGTNGIYAVRATPTAMDRLDVSGRAALSGATVDVVAQPGTYNEHFSQVVLTAGGTFGVSRFAGVTTDLAYLTPSLSYSTDNKQVTLTLTRTIVPPVDPGTPVDPGAGGTPLRFADLVSGRNARAAANAVESMPASHSVYGAAISLPVGAPQGFFSGLSGEAHATVASGLNNLSGMARNTPLAQLRGNLAAGSAPGAATAAAGVSDAAPLALALPASQARPAWAQLVGNWQSIGASGDTASARQHTGGVFAGADSAIGGGWRLGGAVGYTDSRLSVDDLASRADISSYSAIVYGGKAFAVGAGKLNLMAGVAYSWHDIHTRRQIGAGGLNQTLTADYGGNTTQVFSELGYAFGVADGLTLEPYAGLAWAGQRVRGFSESGGSAALSGESSKNDTTTTTLGLRGKQAVTLGTMAGSVSAGLGWRHAFGDLTPTSRLAFDAGQAFTVTGAPIARDAALVEVGADLAVSRRATIGLAYAGQYANANRDHTARIEVRWQF